MDLAELAGDVELARRHAPRALELAQQLGTTQTAVRAYGALGIAHLLAAEWREAHQSLERCLTLAQERQTGLHREAFHGAHFAEACAGLGEVERAIASAEEAILAGRENGTMLYEARAHVALARVLQHAEVPDSDRIEEALQRAEELIRETGGRAFQPPVYEERAKLARLRSDDATCERYLREAHCLYTEMGATGHAERVGREL